MTLNSSFLAEVVNNVDLISALSLGNELWLSLHYNVPLVGGSQTNNELTTTPSATGYGGYARISISRNTFGAGAQWTVSSINDNAVNINNLSFPQRSNVAGTGDAVATHIAIGTASSGAGTVLWQSPLVASGAVWLPCIADSAGDILAAGADFILVSLPGVVTLPADLEKYEVQQLYDDGFPSALSSAFRYRVKAASQALAASSKLWTLRLQVENPATVWTDVAFTNTSPCAFQMIQAAPLTILVNQIPTISSSNLIVDVS